MAFISSRYLGLSLPVSFAKKFPVSGGNIKQDWLDQLKQESTPVIDAAGLRHITHSKFSTIVKN